MRGPCTAPPRYDSGVTALFTLPVPTLIALCTLGGCACGGTFDKNVDTDITRSELDESGLPNPDTVDTAQCNQLCVNAATDPPAALDPRNCRFVPATTATSDTATADTGDTANPNQVVGHLTCTKSGQLVCV